jgi:hypothetical protein
MIHLTNARSNYDSYVCIGTNDEILFSLINYVSKLFQSQSDLFLMAIRIHL